jgi:integrase
VAAAESFRDQVHAGGLGPKTVNKVLTTGAAIFDFAMRRQYVQVNPFELAERLRDNPAEMGEDDAVITEEDIYTTEASRYRALGEIPHALPRRRTPGTATFGNPLAPVVGLHIRHSSFLREDSPLAHERQARISGPHPRFTFKSPKTRSGIRDLKLPAELAEELQRWRARCPESHLGLLFPNQAGEPMRRETVLDHLHATQRKAGVPGRDVKAFRHIFASVMIAGGKPDTEVAYALGHKDPQVTRTVYAHWYRNQKSEGARALATEILGPKPPSETPQQAPDAAAEDRGDILETSTATENYLH